jgi:hypothetical protein
VLLIGWESKDAHMQFREKEAFKKHIYLLREKTSGGEVVSDAFPASKLRGEREREIRVLTLRHSSMLQGRLGRSSITTS